MGMSPDQIAAAGQYFGQKNAARTAMVQKLGAAPLYTGVQDAVTKRAGVTAGSGGSKTVPSGIVPANATSGKSDLEKNVSAIVGGVPIIGSFLTGDLPGGGGSIIHQALQAQDSSQAPKNFTQGVLNFLSGGAYASGRFFNEIGHNVAASNAKAAADPNYVGSNQYFGDVGHAAVSPFAAAGRGIAEGFGARFNGERPITPGEDLKQIGATKVVGDAASGIALGLGANKSTAKTAGDIAAGSTAFLGDVALDPITYLGGTGLVKGLVKGGTEAGVVAREGGKLGSILKAGGAGVAQGTKDARAELQATKLLKSDAKAAAKLGDIPTLDLAGQRAADTAARASVNPEVLIHPDVAALPDATIAKLVKPEKEIANAVIPNEAALPKIGPELPPYNSPESANLGKAVNTKMISRGERLDPNGFQAVVPQAIRDLLPSLRTAGADTTKLLGDATVPHPLALSPETATAIRNVIEAPANANEITSAIKTIKSTPDGAALLSRQVKVGGVVQPLEKVLNDAAENHLVARVTGGQPSAKGLLNAKAVNQAVAMGESVAGKTGMNADSLTSAVTSAGLGDTPDLSGIVQRALAAKPGAEREAVLQQAFGAGTGFKDFSSAMKAAADGQVESSMMRSMLNALGVKTTAKTTDGLQKALSTRGAMNWEAIQNSIPTAQEVLDNHGVTAAVSDAAKTVDVTQVTEDAAAQYEKNVLETAGTDPTVLEPHNTNTQHALVGTMINRGVKAVMDLSHATKGVFSELYDNAAWLAVHYALTNTIKHAANGNRLEGLARQNFIYDRYAEAIREVETHQRSLGQFPQLQYGKGQQPLYVSFGQIYHGLPRDVIAPALFNAKHELGSGLGNVAFKEGLAVYPTTIGNGVRAAINGADTAAIRDAMHGAGKVGLNAFERSNAGQRALDNLALAISDPAFVKSMKQIHDAQQLVSVGKANRDAAAVIIPLRDAIISAVNSGNRADLTKAVRAAQKTIKNMAPAEATSMTRDIASQGVQNGIVNGLDDVGVAMVRADGRAAIANGDKTVAESKAAQEAVNQKYRAAKTKTGERIVPGVPAGTTEADKTLRNATAEGNQAWAEDMAPAIEQRAQQHIADGFEEDTNLGNIAARSYAEIESGFARVFAKISAGLDGTSGQADLAGFRAAEVTVSKQVQAAFESRLNSFLWGGHTRATSSAEGVATKTAGIADHLGAEMQLGRRATLDEMNSFIIKSWQAITTHEALAGEHLGDAELSAALQRGASGIGNKNVGGADALTAGETNLALEFNRLRSEVYHPDGAMMRVGVTTKDLMRELDRFGLGKGGDMANYTPPAGKVADLATLDHAYDFSTMTSPLHILNGMHSALAASTVRPAIAGAVAHLLDHHAAGLTPAQAKAAGWFKVDTKASDSGFGAYVPADSWFPPELKTQMSQVNWFLQEMEKPLPPGLAAIFRVSDPITNIWKQGVTTINPRHHIANILGDLGMNALAGVNPLYTAKATIAMGELGKIGQVDLQPLHDAINGIADSAHTVKPTFHNSAVNVTIGSKGSGFTNGQMTAKQIWEEGHKSGAFQSAYDSLDIVSQAKNQSRVEKEANFAMRANRVVGNISATRDNLPRLAHFMAILESRPFKSMDEAIHYATVDVNKWHPTIASMSPFEQKYARRLLMFYSWSRQALGAVITTSLEHPALVTMPSKYQYEQANQAGFNPDSFGKPAGDDPRIPSYEQDSVYGATYAGGDTPLSLGQTAADGTSHLWGLSLSTPQLDAMTSFFGGVNADRKVDPVTGFMRGMGSQLNPLIKTPFEAGFDMNLSGIGKTRSQDPLGFWAGATGVGGTAVNIFGLNPKALNTVKPTDMPAVVAQKNAQQDASKQRALTNWLSGLKFTDYTNPTASKIAGTETSIDDTARLKAAGYSDTQIRTIKALWKAQKAATKP